MSPYREVALDFACAGERLQGIVTAPLGERSRVGVIVVVGGPQYRVGAHRQFVLLARALAASGHTVLRFDFRGMGDSTGRLGNFEAVSEDIGAAIDALSKARPDIGQIVLWGLCDGASAALLYLNDTRDARVCGLCLVNPWVRSAKSLARTHVRHYYLQRLAEPDFWRKLLRGGVGSDALRGLARSLLLTLSGHAGEGQSQSTARDAPYQELMARALQRFDGKVLVLLSGSDYTAKEFADHAAADPMWAKALRRPGVERREIENADHTLSERSARLAVEEACLHWLRQFDALHTAAT